MNCRGIRHKAPGQIQSSEPRTQNPEPRTQNPEPRTRKPVKMNELFGEQQWLIIVLVFFGVFFYIAWARKRDRNWIDQNFAKEQIRALSFGINCFGRASDPGKIRSARGLLLLLNDRLIFRSRNGKVKFEIPGSQITKIYHGTTHKGQEMSTSLMKIAFSTGPDEDDEDIASFKVPYPPQWMQAIDNAFSVSGQKED